jgi:hypothetical protein
MSLEGGATLSRRYIDARGNFLFIEALIEQETHCADYEPNFEALRLASEPL